MYDKLEILQNPHHNIKFCSGYGQKDTPKYSKNPKEFLRLTIGDIIKMTETPAVVPKEQAPWFIPSTLPSRVNAEQLEHGNRYALIFDKDENPEIDFEEFVKKVRSVILGEIITYTTKSATEDNQKARAIIPLAKPVSGEMGNILQTIFNNRMESAGVVPDRAMESLNQLCYLPNKGAFYKNHVVDSPDQFDPLTEWDEDIAKIQEQREAKKETDNARHEASMAKAAERVASGTHSPMDAYKQSVATETALEHYGYKRVGKRWVSPNSESGNPGVSIKYQKWTSHHSSDRALEIGDEGNGCRWGDSWDLFKYYEHGNDQKAALQAAGDMFTTPEGLTLTNANQIKHMEEKNRAAVKDFDVSETAKKPVPNLSLSGFSLNGESGAMEKKMLDDKFVLGKWALLGQSTIIYATSNAGKTLIVIYELIKSIKLGLIKGEDVFYINADDNHKGLTHKLMLAEKYGFNMLAPGYKGFSASLLIAVLQQMINDGTAMGKIIILDTVKKFVDLMNKKSGSEFAEHIRQFVLHGGTVLMLGHVNKYDGEDGKPIYAGTTDMKDDSDCTYTIHVVEEDKFNGPKTIKFENKKNRGDVVHEMVYKYDCSTGLTYQERLDSIVEVDENSRDEINEIFKLKKRYLKNKEIIKGIINVLRVDDHTKSGLVTAVVNEWAFPRRQIIRVLDDHTGMDEEKYQFWRMEMRDRNAKFYVLN
jgi:hypothetical protein